MAPPAALSLSWSSSTMLSLSPLMAPASAAVKFKRKGFELATRLSPDHHNSRIQVTCGNALSVAVSTSKSTSVSGSSGNILLTDMRGNSTTLDITGLECFNIISPKRQEILGEDDTKHLKIALPLKSDPDLYEFDTYHKDQHSHFDSCLAPFLEQLQVCSPPSTGSQQLVQSVCTNPNTSRETTSENQEMAFSIAGRDVVALAKAAVEAAKHVAALVESHPFAEAYGQKSFVFATEPLHPSISDKDTIDKIDISDNSQTFEVDLAGGKISKLDEQQSQSHTSVKIPLNKENVRVSSNLQIAKKAKRNRVSRKVNESSSGFVSSRVHQSGKLLSAKEEVELSQRVQILLKLEKVKDSLQERLGRQPTSVEWAQAVGIDKTSLVSFLKEGLRSKDKMMKSNIRLVVSVAKRYKGLGISLPDLIQEGNRGLMRGIEKFDCKKGYKFSTYAHWWIRQSMMKFINDHSRTVRMPVSMCEVLFRIKAAKKLLSGEDGSLASNEEVAELVGVTVPRVRETLKSARRPISLDRPVGKDFNTTIGEIVADMGDGSAEPIVMRLKMKQDIDKLLRTLTPKQREIISLRHGLIDGRARTLEEVGDNFSISRERIRQLELDAWGKLKKQKAKSLRYYLHTL